jgi:hypothetical protein
MVGVAGVLLFFIFWMFAWIIDPPLFRYDPDAYAEAQNRARDFNIELTPETFTKPAPPPPPSKFVETNPDAPENIPDKTNNFGAQNQQVAQEKPTPDGKSDRPATEGKKDFESTQIVSGSLTQPREQAPPAPPAVEQPVAETPKAAAKAEKNPLAGEEKFQGENPDGFAGSLAKRVPNMTNVPERQEGTKTTQDVEGPATVPAIDPRRPRPRPMIVRQQQVRPAILSENKLGTTNIGPTAIDARWSNYGAYLQRMIDTVQIQWERIIIEQRANAVGGSQVSVKFIMDSEGKIAKILKVDSTANETASRACISAITDRAPYGPWTDDMRAVLGDQQEMTFTFYYQ